MKTTIYINEKCGIYFNGDNDSWDCPFEFSNINDALAYCEEEIDLRQQALYASIYSLENGNILAHCSWDDPNEEDDPIEYEEPDCDWGYNEDMGYDPYLGCYTDDC